jgi:hypothetical protein
VRRRTGQREHLPKSQTSSMPSRRRAHSTGSI